MSKKSVKWLYDELPQLVSAGVLSAESAECLRRHYGEVEDGRWRQIAMIIFAVFGASLIGLGIILILARNWDALSRPTRTALAFAPLLLGQVLGAWVVLRRSRSIPWREGTGTLLVLAVAASIALVDQTYHVPGGLDSFLLAWMVLSLPVVYLLGATMPALLYLTATLFWAASANLDGPQRLWLWLLAGLVVPYVVWRAREDRYAIRPVLLGWALAVWLAFAVGMTLGDGGGPVCFTAYAATAAALYLAGRLWFGEGASVWRRPFHAAGALGVAAIAYLLTFGGIWDGMMRHDAQFRTTFLRPGFEQIAMWAILLVAVCWLGLCLARRRFGFAVYGAAPVVTVAAMVAAMRSEHWLAPTLLFNAYLLVLGVATLAAGIRDRRLALANAGTLLVGLLIVTRFFDSDLGFVARGIACMAAGLAFLATNLVLHRLRKGVAR